MEFENDVSRYEAVALAMIQSSGEPAGDMLADFPPQDCALHLERFFETLYLRYEERYLLGAPELQPVTRRLEWSATSPAFAAAPAGVAAYPALDYTARLQD